jgi:hypothetical protein
MAGNELFTKLGEEESIGAGGMALSSEDVEIGRKTTGSD